MEQSQYLYGKILAQFHPNIKNCNLVINQNISSNGVNKYSPINWPELLTVLIPHLKIHGVLAFIRVSKSIYMSYFGETRTSNIILRELMVNAMEYNCAGCVGRMIRYHNDELFVMFKLGCKHGSVKSINALDDSFFNKNTSNCNYSENDKEIFINDCVMNAFDHELPKTVLLLESITKHFKIENIDTLISICVLENEIIIKNIMALQNLSELNTDIKKIVFPYLLKYKLVKYVKCIVAENNDDNRELLLNILRNSINDYNVKIRNLILQLVISYPLLGETDWNIIINMAAKIGYVSVIKQILANSSIGNNEKLLLVPRAYEFNLSKYLGFLDKTKELNILSIQEASKYQWVNVSVYTCYLTPNEILNFGVNIDNINVKKVLMLKIGDLKNMDIDLKKKMIPIFYQTHIYDGSNFIDESIELNILSIKEAIKNNIGRVYTSQFSLEDLLYYIRTTENEIVKESLIEKIKDVPELNNYDDDMEHIVKYVLNKGNRYLIYHLCNLKNLREQFIKLLVPIIYNSKFYYTHTFMDFLDETRDLNILSIEQSLIKGNIVQIFKSKLLLEDLLHFIKVSHIFEIKRSLIMEINDTHNLYDHYEAMRNIIIWSVFLNDIHVIRHLYELKNLDVKLKKLLVRRIYEHDIKVDLNFLQDSEELNIISIDQAVKYNRNTFFANNLSNDTLLKFIFSIKQTDIKLKLIQKLRCRKLKCYDKDHIYDENMSTDSIIEIDSINHAKYLLKLDGTCYYEILDKIWDMRGVEFMDVSELLFFVDNPKFCNAKPSIVMRMLVIGTYVFPLHTTGTCQYFKLFDRIVSMHHKFFKQFSS
jgi:hypothetical protein